MRLRAIRELVAADAVKVVSRQTRFPVDHSLTARGRLQHMKLVLVDRKVDRRIDHVWRFWVTLLHR